MRIALLGLGRMGRALGGRLVDAGHDLTVWNRSSGRAGDLVARGAHEAGAIADAATGAEVVITLLANDAAVRQVALGDDGVVAHLGADAVYADCSTVSPDVGADLADAAGASRFVAMPILGAPAAVAGGSAVYLPGGDPDTVARLDPVLADLTDAVRRFPSPRLSAAAKLTNNLLLLSAVVTLSEAFAVGRAGGLSDDQLRELLADSPMIPRGLANRFEGILSGRQEPWWSAALGAKDAGLAVAVGHRAGLGLPGAEAVREQFDRAAASGLDAEDIAAVSRLYRQA